MTATAPLAPITRSGLAPINGLHYYYEIRGEGRPLLLLHGGLGSIEMFAPVMPALADGRQVVAVDLHGHGRTRLGDRAIVVADQGDDLAALLDHLGYAQVDVLGYSMGAMIAFRLAAQHPGKVRRLALVSMGFAQDAFFPDLIAQQAGVTSELAPMMVNTPMYASYAALAPDVTEFPRLLDAIGVTMRTPFDWRDDVRKLTMPVLLMFGDSDMFRLAHVVEFFHLLGGNLRDGGWMREHVPLHQLAILPGVTHYEMCDTPRMPATARSFLDAA